MLNEAVMGFLALAALAAGLAPVLFALAPRLDGVLAVAEWLIIAIFAAEYFVNFALAHDRRRFVLNPWRILDAIIILAPLVSLLPAAPEFARSSPVLRVLRLARVILFGARARRGLSPGADMGIEEKAPAGPLRVRALSPAATEPTESDW